MIQSDDEIIPMKILAKAITDVVEGSRKMLAGGLKQETIVILLHDKTRVNKTHIRMILNALPELGNIYLTGKT